MITIEDIRSAFSRGNVIASPHSLMISYSSLNDWFVQDFVEKELWMGLLSESKSFQINNRPGRYVRFVFDVDMPVESMVILPALDPIEPFDLDELLKDFKPDHEIMKDFLAFMGDVDRNNPDALIQRVSEWQISRLPVKKYVNLDAIARRRLMGYKFRTLISNGFYCDNDIEDPTDYSDGSYTLEITSSSHIPNPITDEAKEAFADLIELSSSFGFEGDPKNGLLRITFWV